MISATCSCAHLFVDLDFSTVGYTNSIIKGHAILTTIRNVSDFPGISADEVIHCHYHQQYCNTRLAMMPCISNESFTVCPAYLQAPINPPLGADQYPIFEAKWPTPISNSYHCRAMLLTRATDVTMYKVDAYVDHERGCGTWAILLQCNIRDVYRVDVQQAASSLGTLL